MLKLSLSRECTSRMCQQWRMDTEAHIWQWFATPTASMEMGAVYVECAHNHPARFLARSSGCEYPSCSWYQEAAKTPLRASHTQYHMNHHHVVVLLFRHTTVDPHTAPIRARPQCRQQWVAARLHPTTCSLLPPTQPQ